MTTPLPTLEAIIELVVDRIAASVAERLATRPRGDEHIALARVGEHGAPSGRWVQDCAREGRVTIHGPRGGRYVLLAELEALLASSTLAPRARSAVSSVPPMGTDADARATVVDLAARRSGQDGSRGAHSKLGVIK